MSITFANGDLFKENKAFFDSINSVGTGAKSTSKKSTFKRLLQWFKKLFRVVKPGVKTGEEYK